MPAPSRTPPIPPWRRALAFARALYLKWQRDDVTRLAAAVAFFALLALAPLLLLAVALAERLYDLQRVQDAIAEQAARLLGDEGAAVVRTLLDNAGALGGDPLVVAVSAVTLAFSATNLFVQLQRALNEIWDVAVRPDRGWAAVLRERLTAFALVLAVEALLLLSPFADELFGWLLGGGALGLGRLMFALLVALVFAALFKVLPDARVAWLDVAVGAAAAAVLFVAAQALMRRLLGSLATTTAYDAAGSLVIVLLWTFVSAMILFAGAELTQLVAALRERRVMPYPDAITVERERHLYGERFAELLARARGEGAGGQSG